MDYNMSCNCDTRLDGDGDGADGGDDVDDDLDDARDDGDDDDDDLPLQEELSPSRIWLPERYFLLCWFPPRSGGGKTDLIPHGIFRTPGVYTRKRGSGGGSHHPSGQG